MLESPLLKGRLDKVDEGLVPVTVLGDSLPTEGEAGLSLHRLLPSSQFTPLQDLKKSMGYCFLFNVVGSFDIPHPISVPVKIDELLLGDELLVGEAGLRVKHEGERLVLHHRRHPGEQQGQECVSG